MECGMSHSIQMVPTKTAGLPLGYTGLTEIPLWRQSTTLPRNPIQCLTVSVTRTISPWAVLKLQFQYHFPTSELPFHICACVWFLFLSTSTSIYRVSLHQYTRQLTGIGLSLKTASVFGNPWGRDGTACHSHPVRCEGSRCSMGQPCLELNTVQPTAINTHEDLKFLSAKYLSHKGGFFQVHLVAWILMICLHHLFMDWDGSQSFLIASYRHLDTRHRWFMFPKQTGKLWGQWDPSVWTRSRRAVSSDYKVF